MVTKRSLRAIVIVFALSGVAILYLSQHCWSVRLTQELVRVQEERKVLAEEVDSLEVELSKVQSFCRLDSLIGGRRATTLVQSAMVTNSHAVVSGDGQEAITQTTSSLIAETVDQKFDR